MSLVLRKFWIVCSIILVLSLPAGATSMGEVEDNIIKKVIPNEGAITTASI